MKKMPSGIAEYIAIASRRRWWLLVPMCVIPVVVFFGSLFLPRSYRSDATIMIDPQKVPEAYVQATVADNLNNRIQIIQQEVLSRTQLRKVIIACELMKGGKETLPSDEEVDTMHRAIVVESVANALKNSSDSGDHSKTLSAFRVSYSNSNPAVAQKVTRTLASLFIEENLKDREQQSEGTIDFLDSQLERMRVSLQEQETRIEGFKMTHAGELPEQQLPSLQLLAQMQGMMQINADSITRAQQQRAYLASQLQNQGPFASQQNMKTVLETQYDSKTADLLASQQKYNDNHPDVMRLKAELSALRAQIEEEKPKNLISAGHIGQSPSQIEIEIQGLDLEITKRTARDADMEGKIRVLQGHLSDLPKTELELAQLSRDYATSRTTYDALLTKRNNSSVSGEMERKAQGEQFRILDPASYPAKPDSPNLLQINLLGFMTALFFGCSVAMVVEMSDSSVHCERDLRHMTSLSVLATIPRVLLLNERRSRTRKRLLTVIVAGILLVAALMAAYILRYSIMAGFGWS